MKRFMTIALAFTLTGLILAAGCGKPEDAGKAGSADTAAPGASQAEMLNGAGASFPFPLYSKWFYSFGSQGGTKINYQSIGSGGGIRQIKAGTVDFGASDAPLDAADLQESGLFQFPTVAGVVAVVYNVPGVEKGLKISSANLAEIFLGIITRWSDPKLAADNPGARLPDIPVIVAHRSDGSGTTNLFTWYLEDVSPAWKEKVGSGKAVDWPAGIGGKGNEGVAGIVSKTLGAVGYVELAYALQNGLPYAMLGNRDGNFVYPTTDTCKAAAANADVPDSYFTRFTYAPGKDSYPIAGFTYLIVRKDQVDPEKAESFMNFVEWAFEKGDASAEELHYVPLPEKLKERIIADLQETLLHGGKPAAQVK